MWASCNGRCWRRETGKSGRPRYRCAVGRLGTMRHSARQPAQAVLRIAVNSPVHPKEGAARPAVALPRPGVLAALVAVVVALVLSTALPLHTALQRSSDCAHATCPESRRTGSCGPATPLAPVFWTLQPGRSFGSIAAKTGLSTQQARTAQPAPQASCAAPWRPSQTTSKVGRDAPAK